MALEPLTNSALASLIGAGTTGHVATLQANGTVAWAEAAGADASGIAGAIQFSDGASGFNSDATNLFWDNANNRLSLPEIRAAGAAGLKLYDDGGNGIFVKDGGNVGIGTTEPGEKLDVAGNINVSGTVVAGGNTLASEAYVKSRGANLITNGTGLMGDNTNFSTFTFDSSQAFSANGSFKSTGSREEKSSDELIPVDVSQTYLLSAHTKYEGDEAPRQYIGTEPFDADGNTIIPHHHMRQADTRLAQPLAPGDTVIYLEDATGWNNAGGSSGHLRSVIIWNYKNDSGYDYGEYTYSRNYIIDAYADGGVDYDANTITLRDPLPAGAGNPDDVNGEWPVGHAISNGRSGSEYKYIASLDDLTTAGWTKYSGYQGGLDYSGTNDINKFPPGTVNIGLKFLVNRSTSNPQTTYISNVSLSQAVPLLNVPGDLGIGTTNPSANLHIQTTASEVGLMVQGAASQSAVLAQLRGTSSTGAGRQHLDIDAEFADSTDATRKSIAYLRVWDTAAREALRMEADGSAARLGFFGVSAVNRPQVTASGVSASDLLTALNSLGLLESI